MILSEKKKILFLIPTLMNGGAERVLVNLVNNLNFDKYDISVKTIMNVGRYVGCLDKRIHYSYIFSGYRRATTWFFKLFTPKQAYNLFIGDKYDIVISYLEGYTARIMSGCSNPNVKSIAWVHIEMHNKKSLCSNFRSYRESLNCYSKFDKIICVSNTVKLYFDKLTGLDTRTDVIYNTNDSTDICIKMQNSIKDVEFKKECMNIISAGKLTPAKGFDRLARVHKRLLDDGINNQVYILGTGESQHEIELILKQNRIEDSFFLIGYRENPYSYIAKSDLYVCSSRREGFSTAVTEALIVGIPVVSTRCSGAEELLGCNNEYGIVTDNNEEALYRGIKEMLTVPGNLDKYRNLSKERGSKFSKENAVKAVENMLDNILS